MKVLTSASRKEREFRDEITKFVEANLPKDTHIAFDYVNLEIYGRKKHNILTDIIRLSVSLTKNASKKHVVLIVHGDRLTPLAKDLGAKIEKQFNADVKVVID